MLLHLQGGGWCETPSRCAASLAAPPAFILALARFKLGAGGALLPVNWRPQLMFWLLPVSSPGAQGSNDLIFPQHLLMKRFVLF